MSAAPADVLGFYAVIIDNEEVCDFHPDRPAVECHGGEMYFCCECHPRFVALVMDGDASPEQAWAEMDAST